MALLVINGGSSTFKFSLFDIPLKEKWQKTIEGKAIRKTLHEITEDIKIVGHRVVHGGNLFQKPTLITPEVKAAIKKLSHLAPLHNPINLEGIEIAESLFPDAKQYAVFDTAFHSTMPEVAYTYPGPLKWREEGIRRYGFHGISHQYCLEKLGFVPNKLITCHLGNGCSCAAILNGKVIDTTMGFTPMEGLMMGTRSGSIDPGILIYLQREKKYSVEALDHCLNYESGLLGIGGTSDMRQIIANPRSKLAFDIFVYRLKQAIGSLAASLNGLDTICFTGGIGENCPEVVEEAMKGLKFLGKVDVHIIKDNENWMIAKAIS